MSAINHVDPHQPQRGLVTGDPGQSAGQQRIGHNPRGNDAARVTISQQASASVDVKQLAGDENAAAAQSSPSDIDRATELVTQLAGQVRAEPQAAVAAQARINPRAALNLLI
ncbi:MAG TPA: hypothetical protein VMU39_28265 [Solirubrobacteraceae bacterium]|nr:hypothetical protein [Solirubrobacteraceae bacterium]